MRSHKTRGGWPGAILLGLWLLAAPAPMRAAGVTVALVPSSSTVAPGAEFDVYMQATLAGDLFNGFDAVVRWDPAALTFLPLSPLSLQEGSYMKGACGNTFHDFRQGAMTDTIADVLMCSGIFLPGPGQLYRLHFRASNTPQATSVRFDTTTFYRAGVYVWPVHTTNAIIGIGMPAPVGVNDPPVPCLALSVAPNPGRGAALRFVLEADRPGLQRLTVHDVQGRTVVRLVDGWYSAGTRVVTWEGRDRAGARLPAGIYLVTLEAAGKIASTRATLLP